MAVASLDVTDMLGDETGVNAEQAEEKLLHRKLRNRASAATSRERKRRYVKNLENKVSELENVVKKLEVENATLMESHFLGQLFGGKGIMLDDSNCVEMCHLLH